MEDLGTGIIYTKRERELLKEGFFLTTITDTISTIQKFPDWPPGARTANGTALCH
jgi:hypothetical protein